MTAKTTKDNSLKITASDATLVKHATILAAHLLVVWGFYRMLFKLPEEIEEVVVKPLIWLLPVLYFVRQERGNLASIGITFKNLFPAVYLALGLGAVFAIEGQRLRFAVQQKWMKVDAVVHVPAEAYENIRIRLFNGSIQSENLNVKDCRAKTANGKVLLEGLECGKLEAETANGHIGISRSAVRDLEAETINGAIKVDGYFNQVDLQSFNGNLTCTVLNQDCENVELKATTGSIDVFLPEKTPASGELKSNLGGFSVELDEIQVVEEKSDMVQKTLRFKPADGSVRAVRLYADTKTGSIAVKKTTGVHLEK